MNEYDSNGEVFEITPDLEELIQRIESAFKGVSYPGDENLISTPEHRAECTECWRLYDRLRGVRWEAAVADATLHGSVSHAMSFFSSPAWQYYLPAELILSIQSGYMSYVGFSPRINPDTAALQRRRAALLSREQCAVVVEYLKAGLERFGTTSDLMKQRFDAAIDHWKKILVSKGGAA